MSNVQILIVEDDGTIASDLQNRLKGLGYFVPSIVSFGEEAIQKTKEINPDLVVMDIMLDGEMDGIEAADQIRTRFNIPVVYLTAYADDNLLERAKLTEPFGYIIKPFGDRELHSAIEIALYNHKAEEALQKAHDKLERQVEERTVELVKVNEQLKDKIQEQKMAEKEIQRNYDIQKVINSLLRVSLGDDPLDKILKRALDLIHSIPWLAFEGRGSIFLVEDDPEVLVMEAQSKLDEPIQRLCSRVPFGRCICGRAALTQKIQFADCLNDQHDILYEGISAHGHYCVPILLAGRTVGVINVYLKEGHCRSQKEERLLSVVADTLAGIIMRKQVEGHIRQSKIMLQAVFDGISDPLIMLDKDSTVRVLNQAAKDYYQVVFQDVIGKPCYQGIKGRSEPCDDCNIPSTAFSGEHFDFEQKGLMDPERLEKVVIYPIKEEDTETVSAIIRISDITEERKMEQELVQSQKMIALGVLAAGMAHEINNPNNLIMLNAPLLREAWESIVPILDKHHEENGDFNLGDLPYSMMRSGIPKLLSGMEEGSKRIKHIVQDLKEFSRHETGEMDQSVHVNKIIKSAVRLVGNLIKKSTKIFKVEYGRNLPSAKGNIQKLEQVVINLIQNACQALPNKEKGIVVASTYNAEKDSVIIEVRDEGVGIPDEALPHIMDPFYTTRRSNGGTGLGLSVSANIVKDHGGRITVESQRGVGTAFTVFLPISRNGKLVKILVVDDDDGMREFLTTALSKNPSCLVLEASNGTEACIKLGRERPDLLILDVMMPDMDGVEVCRLIKKDPELSGIKIIVITGYPDSSQVKEIAAMGFKNILPKPFSISDITKMVDTVLKN